VKALSDGDAVETWGVMHATDQAFAVSPRHPDTMYQVAPTASIVPHAVSGTPVRLHGTWRDTGVTDIAKVSGPHPHPDLPPNVTERSEPEFTKDEILGALGVLADNSTQWMVTSTGGGFRPDGSYGAEAEVIRLHQELVTWSTTLPAGLLVLRPLIRRRPRRHQ